MAPGVGQQGTIPSQYQHGPVHHVQTQFPSGQRRFYNVDRRVAKAPEMYGPDASAVLHGSPVVHYVDGTVPTGYEIPGERGQNNQHQFARFVQLHLLMAFFFLFFFFFLLSGFDALPFRHDVGP